MVKKHQKQKSNQEKEDSASEIELLQAQLDQSEEKYRRALADYHNLQQRSQTERLQFIQLANKDLITALLEPLDFLETATQHIDDQGLQMVIDRFHQVLIEKGLEEIQVKPGQQFDENLMEAVDTAEGKENTVIDVKQRGYKLNGIVIRHAKVVVGAKGN